MVDFLLQAWTLILFSLVVSAFAFPLVFIMSFIHDALAAKYEQVPRIAWMFVATFLGVLVAAALLEIYLGYTISSIVTAAGAP